MLVLQSAYTYIIYFTHWYVAVVDESPQTVAEEIDLPKVLTEIKGLQCKLATKLAYI